MRARRPCRSLLVPAYRDLRARCELPGAWPAVLALVVGSLALSLAAGVAGLCALAGW